MPGVRNTVYGGVYRRRVWLESTVPVPRVRVLRLRCGGGMHITDTLSRAAAAADT